MRAIAINAVELIFSKAVQIWTGYAMNRDAKQLSNKKAPGTKTSKTPPDCFIDGTFCMTLIYYPFECYFAEN